MRNRIERDDEVADADKDDGEAEIAQNIRTVGSPEAPVAPYESANVQSAATMIGTPMKKLKIAAATNIHCQRRRAWSTSILT